MTLGCLLANAASQIEYRWHGRKIATKSKGSGGAIAVARALPGERLIELKKDRPEAL